MTPRIEVPTPAPYDRPMSLHFEVVVSCYVRDDLDPTALQELRWHIGKGPRPVTASEPEPFFGSDEASRLPGGDITKFETALGHRSGQAPTGLFVRRFMLDDRLYDLMTPICRWVADVALDGYAGFWREEDGSDMTVLLVRAGHTYVESNGEIGAGTLGAPPWNSGAVGSA
jgi:hypothetical protein